MTIYKKPDFKINIDRTKQEIKASAMNTEFRTSRTDTADQTRSRWSRDISSALPSPNPLTRMQKLQHPRAVKCNQCRNILRTILRLGVLLTCQQVLAKLKAICCLGNSLHTPSGSSKLPRSKKGLFVSTVCARLTTLVEPL